MVKFYQSSRGLLFIEIDLDKTFFVGFIILVDLKLKNKISLKRDYILKMRLKSQVWGNIEDFFKKIFNHFT